MKTAKKHHRKKKAQKNAKNEIYKEKSRVELFYVESVPIHSSAVFQVVYNLENIQKSIFSSVHP